MTTPTVAIEQWRLDQFVGAEADGMASPEQVTILEGDPLAWRRSLAALLRGAEEAVASARNIRGEERQQVLADLTEEYERLADAWERVTGESAVRTGEPAARRERAAVPADASPNRDDVPELVAIQVSWEPGRVIAWAAASRAEPAGHEELAERLEAARAPRDGWVPHPAVPLPGDMHAAAVAIPVGDILGWLVVMRAEWLEAAADSERSSVEPGTSDAYADGPNDTGLDDEIGLARVGPSVLWLSDIAIWAVELVAEGSVVPLLRQRRHRNRGASASQASYSVRWTPSLIDPTRVKAYAASMPGALRALDPKTDARSVIRSALTGMVDAICRDSVRRVDLPAAPPFVRTSADISEAYLGRLDGSAFDSPMRHAGDIVGNMERWSRSVTAERRRLSVRLDPPDSAGAWHLAVLSTTSDGEIMTLDQARGLSTVDPRDIDDDLGRLERLLPELRRASNAGRGEVILSQDEAWRLMTKTGAELLAAGFAVSVPALSRRRASPSLRVFAESGAQTAVGANQLANVRWSAVFDDVELTAEDIARLAREARPLIRSGGRWIAVERADLQAAAAALAEREQTTQLTGAEMLRLALGLESSPLSGGVSLGGDGWAADLLAAADTVSSEPAVEPDGFVGELRSYQAEALAWLGFLDTVGLGGCLALDMGLGKTPTMLAHLLARVGNGPALVVAPPAVVGNWALEARRFAPSLRVIVHHGASRASRAEIAREVERADVVITTYGTAVRDIAAFESVEWGRVVLDEAQAIKNPANDTSQQLRRLNARSRVALTGTPVENGLGDLWAILDYTNPGLLGPRAQFVAQLSRDDNSTRVAAEDAMRALNGILVFRRTKMEPLIAAELPDRIDELDHCAMTPEQIGMYQAVIDKLVTADALAEGEAPRKGQILAAITALKQICNHPGAYAREDDRPLAGRSGKLQRLEEIVDAVFAAGERVLIFTHFAEWGVRLAEYLAKRTGTAVECYHGGLNRKTRDEIIETFQRGDGAGALVLSLKAGGTGLNLTAASHVVLYDRWWNPAVEDQARDRAWRIGQSRTVICHRLVCPGTVDERVEEVVAGKRRIADLVLPKASSLADLDRDQLRMALGMRTDELLREEAFAGGSAT